MDRTSRLTTIKLLPLLLIGILFSSLFGCDNANTREPLSATPSPDALATGSVLDPYGAALYGTAVKYTKDIYLGRTSVGTTLELLDTQVHKNALGQPIVKVRVLSADDFGVATVGRTGWIQLNTTSFVDVYDPETKTLTP